MPLDLLQQAAVNRMGKPAGGAEDLASELPERLGQRMRRRSLEGAATLPRTLSGPNIPGASPDIAAQRVAAGGFENNKVYCLRAGVTGLCVRVLEGGECDASGSPEDPRCHLRAHEVPGKAKVWQFQSVADRRLWLRAPAAPAEAGAAGGGGDAAPQAYTVDGLGEAGGPGIDFVAEADDRGNVHLHAWRGGGPGPMVVAAEGGGVSLSQGGGGGGGGGGGDEYDALFGGSFEAEPAHLSASAAQTANASRLASGNSDLAKRRKSLEGDSPPPPEAQSLSEQGA